MRARRAVRRASPSRAAACDERTRRSFAPRARHRRSRSRARDYARDRVEPDRERRALAGLALDGNRAAHRLGQLLHDRKPESGADLPLATVALVHVEALEGAVAVGVLETRP